MENPKQRLVDAASAPRPQTTAPNSIFGWRPPGTSTPTVEEPSAEAAPTPTPTNAFGAPVRAPAPTEPPLAEEENEVRQPTARRGRPTRAESPRMKVLTLLSDGPLTFDEIKTATQLDTRTLSNTTYRGKEDGCMEFVKKDGKFRITAAGRDWITAGAGAKPAPAPAKKARTTAAAPTERRKPKVKRRTPKALPVMLRPVPAPAREIAVDFDFALSTSGRIRVTKDGHHLELTRDETRLALQYLDRIAVEEPATAA